MLILYNKVHPCFSDLRGIGIQLSKLEKVTKINTAISNFLKQTCCKRIPKEGETIDSDKTQKNITKVNSNLWDPGEGTSAGKDTRVQRPNRTYFTRHVIPETKQVIK